MKFSLISLQSPALLIASVLVGLILAASGSFGIEWPGLGADAEAVINGHMITKLEFDRTARRVGATSLGDQRALLDYMITEEILVQHAVTLGLLQSHPRLRKLIVRRVVDSLADEASFIDPTQTQLEQFYAARRRTFAKTRSSPGDYVSQDPPTFAEVYPALLAQYRFDEASRALRRLLAERWRVTPVTFSPSVRRTYLLQDSAYDQSH